MAYHNLWDMFDIRVQWFYSAVHSDTIAMNSPSDTTIITFPITHRMNMLYVQKKRSIANPCQNTHNLTISSFRRIDSIKIQPKQQTLQSIHRTRTSIPCHSKFRREQGIRLLLLMTSALNKVPTRSNEKL